VRALLQDARDRFVPWFQSAWSFFVGQILAEGPSLSRAQKVVAARIARATTEYDQETERLRPLARGLSIEDVRKYLSAEAERRKSVEDKAKSNLVGITIGFPVVFAGLNFLTNEQIRAVVSGPWAYATLASLAIGVIYLIYGGLKALTALQIARVYMASPTDEAGVEEEERRAILLWCLEQNEKTTLLRTNALTVSFRSIRNGVITLALLILLLAGRMLLVAGAKGADDAAAVGQEESTVGDSAQAAPRRVPTHPGSASAAR